MTPDKPITIAWAVVCCFLALVLPKRWAKQHEAKGGAKADPDDDGLGNWGEWRARTKPRKAQPVSPALAERARNAVERLAGAPAKVAAGRIEVFFESETELEEIVESLEAAAAPRT